MKKKTAYITMSVILVALIIFIVIRKRGRKVYLKEEYRLNNAYQIYTYASMDDYEGVYYQGTLDYVVVPYGAKEEILNNSTDVYLPIIAVGQALSNGKVQRVRLKNIAYINKNWLAI